MLSAETQASLERLHRGLQKDPDAGFPRALRLLRSTSNPTEALDHLVKLAQDGGNDAVLQVLLRLETAMVMPVGSFWESRSVHAVEDLFSLSGYHLFKVQVLLEAIAANDRTLLELVRARIPAEQNHRVLASLVGYLGHVGDATDARTLLALLTHPDGRVVSNALEALRDLGVPVSPSALRAKLELEKGHRVKAAVIAHLGRIDLNGVVPHITAMATSSESDERAAIAYALGELGHAAYSRQTLVEMLKVERDPRVVTRIGRSLIESVRHRTAASVLGPVYSLMKQAESDLGRGEDPIATERLTILKDILQKIGSTLGWSSHQVEEIGERYIVSQNPARKATF